MRAKNTPPRPQHSCISCCCKFVLAGKRHFRQIEVWLRVPPSNLYLIRDLEPIWRPNCVEGGGGERCGSAGCIKINKKTNGTADWSVWPDDVLGCSVGNARDNVAYFKPKLYRPNLRFSHFTLFQPVGLKCQNLSFLSPKTSWWDERQKYMTVVAHIEISPSIHFRYCLYSFGS